MPLLQTVGNQPEHYQDAHLFLDFQRKTAALEAASKKLMSISSDDLAALSAQARAVTEACGACHEKYRTKRRKGDM